MSKDNFRDKIKQIASPETSADPNGWTPDNPLYGHCAVISLLAQDEMGGVLLRASLEKTAFAHFGSHYWNLLPNDKETDFTEEQFQGNRPNLTGETRSRDYVLSYPATRARYEILKSKFNQS